MAIPACNVLDVLDGFRIDGFHVFVLIFLLRKFIAELVRHNLLFFKNDLLVLVPGVAVRSTMVLMGLVNHVSHLFRSRPHREFMVFFFIDDFLVFAPGVAVRSTFVFVGFVKQVGHFFGSWLHREFIVLFFIDDFLVFALRVTV